MSVEEKGCYFHQCQYPWYGYGKNLLFDLNFLFNPCFIGHRL